MKFPIFMRKGEAVGRRRGGAPIVLTRSIRVDLVFDEVELMKLAKRAARNISGRANGDGVTAVVCGGAIEGPAVRRG